MSGFELACYRSDMYVLTLSGGISSWDYNNLDAKNEKLKLALDEITDELDAVFLDRCTELNLPIEKYNALSPNISFIDGVLIESDPAREYSSKSHFMSYFDKQAEKLARANIECRIPKTCFKLLISVVVSQRLKRHDLFCLANAMSEQLNKDTAISKLLY